MTALDIKKILNIKVINTFHGFLSTSRECSIFVSIIYDAYVTLSHSLQLRVINFVLSVINFTGT